LAELTPKATNIPVLMGCRIEGTLANVIGTRPPHKSFNACATPL
jgi:hypothetical protein